MMSKITQCLIGGLVLAGVILSPASSFAGEDPTAVVAERIAKMKVGKKDWPQWGGSYSRNNTPDAKNIPITWDVATGENVVWSMPLGSETYGNPVVANGKFDC